MNALKGNVSSPYSLNLAIFIFIFFISVLIGMSVWISTFSKAKSLNLASPFTFLIKRWRGHTIELCFWPHSTPNPVYVVNEWSYSVLVLLFFLLRQWNIWVTGGSILFLSERIWLVFGQNLRNNYDMKYDISKQASDDLLLIEKPVYFPWKRLAVYGIFRLWQV